jgi:hypothetical protein
MANITIEARKHLEKEAAGYVRSALVHPMYDSLVRWNTPICPLVAGLPQDRGEYVLWRITQIASAAQAPLAGEDCAANLLIIVTPVPDLLLKQWWRKDKRLFNTNDGMGHVNSFGFIHDKHPIRAWYNAYFTNNDGAQVSPQSVLMAAAAVNGSAMGGDILMNVPMITESLGRHLHYQAVRELAAVIIIVDKRQITDINMGQLADYIAMIALAEIRPDADIGEMPSILRLFREHDSRPEGLSAWDQALLYGLYTTGQSSLKQASGIVTQMVDRLSAHADR